jgi:hypothetical protein
MSGISGALTTAAGIAANAAGTAAGIAGTIIGNAAISYAGNLLEGKKEKTLANMSGREIKELTAERRNDIDKALRKDSCLSINSQKILGIALIILGVISVLFCGGAAAALAGLSMLGGALEVGAVVSATVGIIAGMVMTAIGAILFQNANNKELIADQLKTPLDILDATVDREEAKKKELEKNAVVKPKEAGTKKA